MTALDGYLKKQPTWTECEKEQDAHFLSFALTLVSLDARTASGLTQKQLLEKGTSLGKIRQPKQGDGNLCFVHCKG